VASSERLIRFAVPIPHLADVIQPSQNGNGFVMPTGQLHRTQFRTEERDFDDDAEE